MTAEERKVIFAASLGTAFEWYDFFIYGTLSSFLAKYFFSNVPPNVGFIFALLAFAAGFVVRPFGALIFGHFGDLVGRKYTFLTTMTLMGIGTFFIGLLPGFDTWGVAAPTVLIGLRLVQGLALGGEMAVRRLTSLSMRQETNAAITPPGSKPRRRLASF